MNRNSLYGHFLRNISFIKYIVITFYFIFKNLKLYFKITDQGWPWLEHLSTVLLGLDGVTESDKSCSVPTRDGETQRLLSRSRLSEEAYTPKRKGTRPTTRSLRGGSTGHVWEERVSRGPRAGAVISLRITPVSISPNLSPLHPRDLDRSLAGHPRIQWLWGSLMGKYNVNSTVVWSCLLLQFQKKFAYASVSCWSNLLTSPLCSDTVTL